MVTRVVSKPEGEWLPAPTLAAVQTLIARHLRTVADWPVKGVMFRDITPLLADARVFAQLVDYPVARYRSAGIQHVAGIDARGFILGAVIAHGLGAGLQGGGQGAGTRQQFSSGDHGALLQSGCYPTTLGPSVEQINEIRRDK